MKTGSEEETDKMGTIEKDYTTTKADDENAETDDVSTGTEDAKTGIDDAGSETDDSIYAPDGGWGWLVTLAGFMVTFIEDGIVTSFGLMLPELLDTYGSDVSLTSLPPGIMVAMLLLSGPLTAYLVKRWGCRLVGFCGGLVAALGVAGSAYAPNIEVFILCFGFVAGVGNGLIYLPSVTMVNIYFHKKRGVVAGIITSGSGFGLLAMAPLTEMLIEEYGWRGCYLIMSAITLNFCVCASLMRPLHPPAKPQPQPHTHTHPSQNLADQGTVMVLEEGEQLNYSLLENAANLSLVSLEELDDTGLYTPRPGHTQLDEATKGHHHDVLHNVLHDSSGDLPHRHRQGSLLSSIMNLFLGHRALSASQSHVRVGGSHAQVLKGSHVLGGSDVQVGARGSRQVPLTRSRSHDYLERSPHYHHKSHPRAHVDVLSAWLAFQVPPSLSRHTLHSHHSSDIMMASSAHEPHGGHHGQGRGNRRVESLVAESTRKRQRYYSDSRKEWGRSLPSVHVIDDGTRQTNRAGGSPKLPGKISKDKKDTADQSSDSLIEETTSTSSNENKTPGEPAKEGRLLLWLREQRVFMLFLLGAFLIQFICYVPPLLTPSYAYQYGVSKVEVATILSVYGVLNTVGGLLAGVLVYMGVRTVHVYNLGTVLSGVTCFAFPFSTSFIPICVCLGLHGFFLGAFPPLQPVILVEYLGLERLATSFGTMCLVKAFACAAGAPLAGVLVTQTGTYTIPMAACGAVLVLAAIFHQMMDCCR